VPSRSPIAAILAPALIVVLITATQAWCAPIRVIDSGPGFVQLAGPTQSSGETGHTVLVGIPLTGEPRLRAVEASASSVGSARGPTLGKTGFFRDQRVVEVLFPPAEGDGIVVELSFAMPADVGKMALRGYDELLYRGAILNHEQARPWRHQRGLARSKAAASQQQRAPSGAAYKITVSEEGVYRITGADLIAAGLQDLTPTAAIQLYYGGGRPLPEAGDAPSPLLQPAHFLIEDDGDGLLHREDEILFYGQATSRWSGARTESPSKYLQNPFTEANAYWLVVNADVDTQLSSNRDGRPDVSTEVRRTYIAHVHEEQERSPLYVAPGNVASGKVWYWELLQQGDRHTFDVPLVAAATSTLDLQVRLHGRQDTDARVQVLWNGVPVATTRVEADTNLVVERRVEANGSGQLTLAYGVGTGAIFFDWYEVEYERALSAEEGALYFDGAAPEEAVAYEVSGFSEQPRIFDISDAGLVEITGGLYDDEVGTLSFQDDATQTARRYAVVNESAYKHHSKIEARLLGGLRTAITGADYVIISHAEFGAAAQRLAAWRSSDDRFGPPPVTAVIDVAQVYDDFSGGLFDPTAIRDFLRHAQQNWMLVPSFVVLLGDGTYDYRNHSGTSPGNWIPPYENQESTYDEWYTCVSGDDDVPDMAIGRLSVQTSAEAELVVEKLIDYDRDPEFGSWQGRVLLVADDTFNADEPQKIETLFTRDSEGLANGYLPPELDTEKLYLIEYPFEGRFKPQARDAFISFFNEGAVLLIWIGHGNSGVFAHEHVFVLSTDLQALNNGRRLPFVYAAASQMGVFDDPSEDSVPEALMKWPRGGAIGMVAATRIGFHDSNMELARNFHARMFTSGRRNVPVGLALLEAKLETDINRVNERRYSLFGDPLTRLSVPALGIRLQVPDTLQALGVETVQGEVLAEDGTRKQEFDGHARVQVFDSIVTRQDTWRGEPLAYDRPPATLFRGVFPVVAGRFSGDFPVPKDITYRGTRGRISVYAWDEAESAFGSVPGLHMAGTAEGAEADFSGPDISIGFVGQSFHTGDFIPARVRLQAQIEDPNGINVTGEVGHQIFLFVDGKRTDVTTLFETGLDYRRGLVEIDLSPLQSGSHNIGLEAWDTHNNWAENEVTAVVSAVPEVADALFFPNPSPGEGHFSFTLPAPAQVHIRIFSVAGKLVEELRAEGLLGYNQVEWKPGEGLANGSYLYQISARGIAGEATAQGVVLILR
jgi:hypothetical protein